MGPAFVFFTNLILEKSGSNRGFGAAIDLGTTTLAGSLVDLATGKEVASAAAPNPQYRWGRDVVSRIDAAVKDAHTLGSLSLAAQEAILALIQGLADEKKGLVKEITIAGNSAMEHIFLGISPEPLSKVPYRPAFKEAKTIPARDAGLDMDASLYLFPLIGGFVGGDAVAVALSLGLSLGKGTELVIDIGTNSEILLAHEGEIFATSAAAGPAFEGGEVAQGMVAAPGAIEGVTIEGDNVRLSVIGSAAPKGICGSGLIEAVHALIGAGVIDHSGRIADSDEIGTNLSSRIKPGPGGNSFVLYRGAKKEVSLSQSDVRALQTAKSATRAGINMLLDKAGLQPEAVEKVYVAGAFGSRLSEVSLKGIGLLHAAWEDVEYVGDAALKGAQMALQDEQRLKAGEIAKKAKYVPLSGSAHFEREFIRNMDFGI